LIPVIYHDTRATDGKFEFNARIDQVDDKYILRACSFATDGVRYKLAQDVSFPFTSIAMMGQLWAKDGNVQLLVFDPRLRRAVTPSVMQSLQATYGQLVRNVFRHVSLHHDMVTKTKTVGDSFLVPRQLRLGEVTADKTPVSPTSAVPAIMEPDIAPLASIRAALTAKAELPPLKTWDELKPEDQQAMMKQMAVQLGLVRA
jgi:hypothetical protein